MNDTTYADDHAHDTGPQWPVIRLSLNGAAAVLAVLAFAFMVLELRGTTRTSATAWVLLAFLLVLLAGQVALMVFGRDRVRDDPAQAGAVVQEESGDAWGSLEEQSVWDAPAEPAAQPVDEVITIGCPACSNTFHMSESDIAGGQFHCPKCGVAGYLGE